MDITYDAAKRDWTLRARQLDFEDVALVFEGDVVTQQDTRRIYGEDRFVTGGYLRGRFVVFGWTSRDGTCRVFSMRYGHAEEERDYFGK